MNNLFRNTGIKSNVQIGTLLCLALFVYTIGYIGITIPETRAKSLQFTPYAIALSLIVVLIFAEKSYTLKTILILIAIAALGYFIEVIGIGTHKIFGSYTYGKTLAFSLLNTPLIIGINWLFLVYTSASVFERFTMHSGLKILLASLVMLAYDIILEPAAIKMDMWYWMDSIVPLQNYIAWFIVAVILHTLLKLNRIDTRNPIAPWVLLCQSLFFLMINLFLK
jgi:putative membrane protein